MVIKKDKKPIEQIANRKQKRLAERVLKTKGKSKEEINTMIHVINRLNGFGAGNLPRFKEHLIDGDKVKINYEKMLRHPNWDSYQQAYKDFIENNKSSVFTVKYDEKRQDKPTVVCLAEDNTVPKWLWSDTDLLVYDERDGDFKELYMITEKKS